MELESHFGRHGSDIAESVVAFDVEFDVCVPYSYQSSVCIDNSLAQCWPSAKAIDFVLSVQRICCCCCRKYFE